MSNPYDNAAKPHRNQMALDFEFQMTPAEVRAEKARRAEVLRIQNAKDKKTKKKKGS